MRVRSKERVDWLGLHGLDTYYEGIDRRPASLSRDEHIVERIECIEEE